MAWRLNSQCVSIYGTSEGRAQELNPSAYGRGFSRLTPAVTRTRSSQTEPGAHPCQRARNAVTGHPGPHLGPVMLAAPGPQVGFESRRRRRRKSC